MDIAGIVFSFIAGIGGGFIGAVTGGAGLLTIPAMIFLGLPANQAIATNSLASFGMVVSAVPEYQRARKIRWRIALWLVPVAAIGGYIGSRSLTQVNADALSTIVGILLLLIIPVMLLNPKKGIKAFRPSRIQIITGVIIYFLTTVYGGFFGAGAGIFSMYVLTYFLGMTYIESKASNFIPSFFLMSTAAGVFFAHGLISMKFAIPILLGMLIGGFWGARTALERGNMWVRTFLIIVILASGIKLIFFP